MWLLHVWNVRFLLRFVVDVQGRDGSWFRTRAALDSHSSVSFIDDRLASRLKLEGRSCEFRLTTFSDVAELKRSEAICGINLRSWEGVIDRLSLVYRTNKWPFHSSDVPSSALIGGNSDISARIPDSTEYPVGLLIGMDEPQLVRGLETVDVAGEDSLYLTRYKLGWSICGRVGSGDSIEANCYKISVDDYIREEFARAFVDDHPLGVGESVEDKRWRELVNGSLHLLNSGKLEIGLPFKEDDVSFAL